MKPNAARSSTPAPATPARAQLHPKTLSRQLTPSQIAALNYFALPFEARPNGFPPTPGTRRALLSRKLITFRDGKGHVLTELGQLRLAELHRPRGAAGGAS